MCRVGPERKTLGSGLNVGNIGAEIDVIKPALPAQTHAPIAIHFAFGVSRTSFRRWRFPNDPMCARGNKAGVWTAGAKERSWANVGGFPCICYAGMLYFHGWIA